MTDDDSNLFTHFARQFAARPDKALLDTPLGDTWTYRRVDDVSARYANLFLELGMSAGDRVSVQVEKTPEALCLYLACLRGGFVFHPLNPAYTAAELEYFLHNAEPAAVICDPQREAAIQQIADGAGARFVFTLDADGGGSLPSRAESLPGSFATVRRRADDLAALLYSSGTTGVPKGIMLTHSNLLSNTLALVDAWGFTDADRLLHALPIFHVHGLFVAVGCVLSCGASMRWLPGFNARKVIEYLPECTVLMGVPTFYTRLLAMESFTEKTAAGVRLFVSGSAPLLEETFVEFERRTGKRILERYGMTETNMNTSNPLRGERRPGTVGPPLPGVEVRIVDDDGRAVPAGEVGNLQVRGPNVFIGYWKLPEKTAEDFTADGFFNTGDKGRVDADGYVSIVGRSRDVVITGGLNVYPKEVELFIDRLPGVRESAVIGVPHADFGEGVIAVVVPTSPGGASELDILDACRGSLANFKVPKSVVFVDELPRNTMAKVQKNVLREAYRGLLQGT